MAYNDIWTVIIHDAAPIWITWPEYWVMKYCTTSSRLLKIYLAQGHLAGGRSIALYTGADPRRTTVQKISFTDQQLISKVIIKGTP